MIKSQSVGNSLVFEIERRIKEGKKEASKQEKQASKKNKPKVRCLKNVFLLPPKNGETRKSPPPPARHLSRQFQVHQLARIDLFSMRFSTSLVAPMTVKSTSSFPGKVFGVPSEGPSTLNWYPSFISNVGVKKLTPNLTYRSLALGPAA